MWRASGRFIAFGVVLTLALVGLQSASAAADVPALAPQLAYDFHAGATFSVTAGYAARVATMPSAAPTSATDATKVPHYFGPWPNWANSPLVQQTAKVEITDTGGAGTGARAVAGLDPLTGGVTQIDITDPGHGYVSPHIAVTGSATGHDATATATVNVGGGVISYAVSAGGTGYSELSATLTGGGGTGATAIASGSVAAVQLGDGGSGYTMPTVEFALPDDPNGVQATGHVPTEAADGHSGLNANGRVTELVIDNPGSGYYRAPDVAIHNGTLYDPINGSTAPVGMSTTLALSGLAVGKVGSGYTSAPTVEIVDPTDPSSGRSIGSGAAATATVDVGAIAHIDVQSPGAGYVSGGIKKFQDTLPLPCDPVPSPTDGGCPEGGSAAYLPMAAPESVSYNGVAADQYTIALVQYRMKFNTDLPPTLVRGYVQVETPASAAFSEHVPLVNERLDGGTPDPVLDTAGNQVYGVTAPRWLGPFIQATKNKPVRVIFHNYLPTGAAGDLFLPADPSMMGSGMGPMDMHQPADNASVLDEVRNPYCDNAPKDGAMCFPDNRATIHLHGGLSPWISDGTPHQWITPAGEQTSYPQGVSVANVPDMSAAGCDAVDDGCSTFFYTNQQSARLMFYHDHSWGISRLNVYAGEAGGYSITDPTEKKLVNDGILPSATDTLPLVVQDRTFVPGDSQLKDTLNSDGTIKTYGQDPTWDSSRWGGEGNFWYHHVYMPAQNPSDSGGMSAYGRWMYGPWFWPPAAGTKYGPIANPYFDPNCSIDNPATWQYQTDPYCEPAQIPGTPNISAGMEQFNDTPLVNGVAYPTVTLQPKTYRMRMLNAANDRFFNFQWYVADPHQGDGTTEVALKPDELAAAQLDPNVVPTPVDASTKGSTSTAGPDWIQVANDGGFLPAPAVIDGQQPTTWITDPTRFDVGNVDKGSLIIAPAERADVLVDFSKYAGKTLILYNDAPAAFPARVPQYDYYTGAPDLSPAGAPGVLPGYGPNTRTIMQVKIADAHPAATYDLSRLQSAFKHNLQGTGVFESGQNPIIVGQAAYNATYGQSFAGNGNCSVGTLQRCDGMVRINDTSSFQFNTLRSPNARQTMPLQPKAIHDEMNSSTFDEFGRMQANLGIEAQPPTPGNQNVTLYPYVNPATELIDGTNLPSTDSVTPISSMADGTQIWRITHNGVDTHPIHFHLYDVQVINRVTWDNIIIPPDPNELGWKDTVRTSPLEDTIVALRPIVPKLPWEVPNSVRPLNPMMPLGSTEMFNSTNTQGEPTTAIQNALVNFGWEYVWHCHILSHEEMDMMRPQSFVLPPNKPDGLTLGTDGATGAPTLTFNDNSITETSFTVQRSPDGTAWTDVGSSLSPLDQPNIHESRTVVLAAEPPAPPGGAAMQYRVVAANTAGYGGDYPSLTASSISSVLTSTMPAAASGLAVAQDFSVPGSLAVKLTWTDNATNETGYVAERSADGGTTWTTLTSPPLAAGSTSYVDSTGLARGVTYSYRVSAVNAGGSVPSNVATFTFVTAPTGLTAVSAGSHRADLTWTDTATNETGFVVSRSTDGGTTWNVITGAALAPAAGAGTTVTWSDTAAPSTGSLQYRVAAVNGLDSATSNTAGIDLVTAPSGLVVSPAANAGATLTWVDTATAESGYVVQRSADNGTTWTVVQAALPANTTTATDSGLTRGTTYLYRAGAQNAAGIAWSAAASYTVVAAPTGLATSVGPGPAVTVTWTDVATNETGYQVRRSTTDGVTWTVLPGTLPAGTTTFTDPDVSEPNRYTYQVAAVNGPDVAWSASVVVTVLKAPTNLTASILSYPTRVRLAWTDMSAVESGNRVDRSSDGGATWTTVRTLSRNSGTGTNRTWTDDSVVAGTTYQYRIVAYNLLGQASSNVVSVSLVPPAQVTGVSGSAVRSIISRETLTVTWSPVATATSYLVEYSTNGGSTIWGQNTVNSGTASSYARTFLPIQQFWVRVTARSSLGNGPPSDWVAVPAAP